MTASQLLAYICVALLLQLAVGIGVIVSRRRGIAAEMPKAGEPTLAALSTSAWSGWRNFRVTQRSFEDAAKSQCSFTLKPVDGKPLEPFKPGQYLTFSLQVGLENDTRSIIRCYSLSDQPSADQYRITIKRMPSPPGRSDLPPGASSSYFHDQVHEGDVLKVKAPSGRFSIDPDANVPAVFVAGGIGVTPMMSMLLWCAANQPTRDIHLYYGVRSSQDHAFKELLEKLAASHPAFQLNVVYGDPGAEDVQGRDYKHVGYISVDLLRSTLPHGRHLFYVCGPPPMMQSLVPALRDWGVIENDIHFEAFGPASVRPIGPVSNEPIASPAVSFDIRFNLAGRVLVWDGQDDNLLDFAERQGVEVESGCRTGSCGTCETTLISGTVAYANKPDYDIAEGHCLLCVGRPQSALVLEA